MGRLKITEVDRADIKPGDIIIHNNKPMTVGKNNITRCEFFGIKLFGDSYKLGHKKVKKLEYIK